MNSFSKVQQSFRRSLGNYHQNALIQQGIAVELVALLAAATPQRQFNSVFEFGAGTGFLTQSLLKTFTIKALTLNDIVSESRDGLFAGAADQVESLNFIEGAIETCELPANQDLIASASVVQWIGDHHALLARLTQQLNAGGWLAMSGFGHDHFHELRALGSEAAAPGYRDADEWEDLLPEGLELVHAHQDRHVLYFDTALDLLRHLRDTGVNALASQSWSRRRLTQFEADYRSRFCVDGKLTLTYCPVWVIARKQ